MDLIILLPTIFIVVMGIEACLAALARTRGRVAPWTVSVTTDPPRCANERLNWIECLLMVVIAPIGMVLLVGGLAVAFWIDETAGAALVVLGFLCLSARGIFVAACFAYADLADAPPAATHT
jgi:Na+/H+ antiporter NhaC